MDDPAGRAPLGAPSQKRETRKQVPPPYSESARDSDRRDEFSRCTCGACQSPYKYAHTCKDVSPYEYASTYNGMRLAAWI
jgi:hypothetical protein